MSSDRSLRSDAATVAKEELQSLKAGRAVYEKRSNLFFLSDREAATATMEGRIAAAREAEEKAEKEAREKERRRAAPHR